MAERISITYCDSYAYHRVRAAVESVLEPLGGMRAFVGPGERVLLKPNMLSAKGPDMAVTTHPSLIRVVSDLVREAGGQVLIGDSPGIGTFQRVAERSGIGEAARQSGAALVPFDAVVAVQGTGRFRSIEVAQAYWEADKVINLPKLKTHEMMTMTCAVKNLFGVVVGAAKPAWHLKAGTSREQFARLLLEIYLLKQPVLHIVDAIVSMEGNGPGSGDPVQVGALLAGDNAVAVDVVAARLAGLPSDLLHVEREAVRMGLAGSCPDEIEILGRQLEDFDRPPFRLPTGMDVQFGLPRFLKNGLRKYLMAHPYAVKDLCVLCGACRDACPPGVITIKDSALSVDNGRCIQCWCCRELCPHHAMGVRKGRLLKAAEALGRVRRRR